MCSVNSHLAISTSFQVSDLGKSLRWPLRVFYIVCCLWPLQDLHPASVNLLQVLSRFSSEGVAQQAGASANGRPVRFRLEAPTWHFVGS